MPLPVTVTFVTFSMRIAPYTVAPASRQTVCPFVGQMSPASCSPGPK